MVNQYLIDNIDIILIIIFMIIGYILYKINKCKCNSYEGFSALGPIDNEALQNIASIYNKGSLVVSNLKVTGKLESSVGVINDLSCSTGDVGNLNISSNLNVSGNTLIKQALNVTGNNTIGGNIITKGELDINGNKLTSNDCHVLSKAVNEGVKLFSDTGNKHGSCDGGYVMSGDRCSLYNGGGTYHSGEWKEDSKRSRFKLIP